MTPTMSQRLKTVLTYLPHLKSLSIHRHFSLTDEILEALILPENEDDKSLTGACPELEHFHWRDCSACTQSVMVAMLLSRWKRKPRKLKDISLRLCPFYKKTLIAELRLSGSVPKNVKFYCSRK